LNKKTIFVVDDIETILFVVEYALNEHYTVVALDTIEKMFKNLQHIKPDLILLDYYMPDISWHDVMKQLKKDDQYKDIPVIVMSGSNYPDILDEIYAMGAVGFISKPFEEDGALLAMVNKHLK
jgi:CheY-like chemotaxis protein